MNTRITFVSLSALLVAVSLSVYAANSDSNCTPSMGGMHGMGMGMQQGGMGKGMHSGGMMMGMMNHDQMMAMSEQMDKMRETMNLIQQEKDPKKRQELMQEHLKEMSQGMHMMNMYPKSGNGMMPMGTMMEMMSDRMGMMNENMGMMQMMMSQMNQHNAEQYRDEKSKAK